MKLLFVALFLASCATKSPEITTPSEPQNQPSEPSQDQPSSELVLGQEISLWATFYYAKSLKPAASGVPLRDMSDKIIGPMLSSSDWCKAAIEGTVIIEGQTYNYAGVKSPAQANCSHSPSSRVRWKKSAFPFGIGNRNNELIPFVSIACDQGTVAKSTRWLNGSYMKFGQKIFIPDAVGVALPDGTKHDGIFKCDDVGGAITGNHIDVFIGAVSGGLDEALKVNPFTFIKSRPSGTFKAYLID